MIWGKHIHAHKIKNMFVIKNYMHIEHRHTKCVGCLKQNACVGEWGWGVEGKQVGSMDEESQVRGCYNITFICTPTNQETVSVLEKTQANKTFRT